ncbi:methyltransferase family protein [Gelidibacter algens]|uniref:Methyltransferase family protein n=2 Tax=Gelidibacter algens TaxID=49280 RepID=A0A327SBB1_9FLAO|nr:methyltransferase family protein [Gelidibacter algens]
MDNSELSRTLDTNKKQAEFYNTKKKNLPTRIWSSIREKTLHGIRKDLNIQQDFHDLHKIWFGELKGKKVLDLGCYAGNHHSRYLAENSKQYLGLDLSKVGIDILNKNLAHIPSGVGVVQDFLSESFTEKDFDLIYAYGVLHHFENIDLLISKLNEKLADKGQIISYDPLQTSTPIWLIRKLYRPFQSDAAWEWPFSRKTLLKFDKHFDILEKRGVLGHAKWFFILNLLPIPQEKKLKIGKSLHKKDWENSNTSMSHLFTCMQLTMHMQKRGS